MICPHAALMLIVFAEMGVKEVTGNVLFFKRKIGSVI